MNQDPTDLYSALGVGRRATTAEIEQAYAAWVARADAGEPIDRATWERVRYAYDVLSSPQRRATYESLITEASGTSLALDVVLSTEKLALLDTPQLVYVMASVGLREATDLDRRPLNLGLVIDRSTSMRGERLDHVIAAVELLIDKLGPDDALSLVSFSDRAEVVLPAARLGDAPRAGDKSAAAWHDPHRRVRALTASGATEIFQGLQAGLDQVARLASGEVTSHLILLTDGHTYGDAADCLRLAEDAAGRGIGITAFGLGADWNDSFLDALVAPSGGQSHFIEGPADILPHLEDRLQGLGAIHARNLTMRRTWPAPFTLRAAFKLAPFPQPLVESDPIHLGDLEGRSPVSVLLEFLVEPQTVTTRFRLPVEVRYTSASGRVELAANAAQLVAEEHERQTDTPPAPLIEAVRRLNLYRMQEKAWQEAQSGQSDTAAARMRRLTTRYMETGDLRLARQAQLEAQRLDHMVGMSAEGRKLLKYGTRSLVGQGES